jgi:hypothetical protein
MRNVLDKVVEKIKTHILRDLWDNVEICGGAREASNDNAIRPMCVAC